jgi:hypothetical protein
MDYRWLIALYFLPTIISLFNKRSSTFVIFVGNLLFSWTVIFWFGSLLWAFCDTQTIQSEDEYEEADTPKPPPKKTEPKRAANRSGKLTQYVNPILHWWKHL